MRFRRAEGARIAPGHIPAGMTFYDMSERIRTLPLQWQGIPLYLASDLSAQVTGVILPVDGGTHLGGPSRVRSA